MTAPTAHCGPRGAPGVRPLCGGWRLRGLGPAGATACTRGLAFCSRWTAWRAGFVRAAPAHGEGGLLQAPDRPLVAQALEYMAGCGPRAWGGVVGSDAAGTLVSGSCTCFHPSLLLRSSVACPCRHGAACVHAPLAGPHWLHGACGAGVSVQGCGRFWPCRAGGGGATV